MKNSFAAFREVSSFIAGLLIGLSMVVLVFAMTVANPGNWQALWVFAAPVILAVGLTLQVLGNAKPPRRRATATQPEFGACLSDSGLEP